MKCLTLLLTWLLSTINYAQAPSETKNAPSLNDSVAQLKNESNSTGMLSGYVSRLSPIKWFTWIISTLLFLVTLYILTHLFLASGRSATKLTVDDMTTLSALLYQQDIFPPVSPSAVSGSASSPKSTSPASAPGVANRKLNSKTDSARTSITLSERPLTIQQRQRVYGYIVTNYPILQSDAATLKKWLALFGQPGQLMDALKDHVFTVRSYFWLTGGGLYCEVIFWTWFGLIASLLFNVSESLRLPPHKLMLNETWTHIAKFFYAPLCSIAIFLGLSLAIADRKVLEQVNFSPNQILVAFILGFFSGRAVDLLQRIKNVILPDSAVVTLPCYF